MWSLAFFYSLSNISSIVLINTNKLLQLLQKLCNFMLLNLNSGIKKKKKLLKWTWAKLNNNEFGYVVHL